MTKQLEDRLKIIEKSINKLHDRIDELELDKCRATTDLWNYKSMCEGK